MISYLPNKIKEVQVWSPTSDAHFNWTSPQGSWWTQELNTCNVFGLCCAHKGETGIDKFAQVLTQKYWKHHSSCLDQELSLGRWIYTQFSYNQPSTPIKHVLNNASFQFASTANWRGGGWSSAPHGLPEPGGGAADAARKWGGGGQGAARAGRVQTLLQAGAGPRRLLSGHAAQDLCRTGV